MTTAAKFMFTRVCHYSNLQLVAEKHIQEKLDLRNESQSSRLLSTIDRYVAQVH